MKAERIFYVATILFLLLSSSLAIKGAYEFGRQSMGHEKMKEWKLKAYPPATDIVIPEGFEVAE